MNTVLELSSAYFEESWPCGGGPEDGFTRLDLTGLEGTNCYCDPEAEARIRAAIEPLGISGTHWIDSGDYHYVSKIYMDLIREPFFLVLYDNHPDDQAGAFESEDTAILSCGSWVRAARKTIPLMKGDCLNCPPPCTQLPLWLSIDLDVLSREYARTDWSQGSMSLDELEAAIRSIFATHRVLGVDVCGGITISKGACAEDFAVNSRTRVRIHSLLDTLMAE